MNENFHRMKDIPQNVVITGASGFIGSHLTEKLVELDKNVYVIVKSNYKKDLGWIASFDTKIKRKIKIIVADITKPIPLKYFAGEFIGIVYHLASITSSEDAFEIPAMFYKVNLLGTLNVLEMCRVYGINKIVFSSSYVYGTPKYLPIDEKHPTDPVNPYTGSKLLSEKLLMQYSDYYGLDCVILRPFNIYGERESSLFLIPKLMEQIFKGKIEIRDPEPRRDFLYVSDMVNALLHAGAYNKKGINIFNIGYGKSYSVKEIVEIIVKLYEKEYNKKVKISYLGIKRKNEVADVVADITKSKEELKWEPKVDINDGIKKMFDWDRLK